MKSLLFLTFAAAAVTLVSASIGQSSFYGTISSAEDCERFNNNPGKAFARAIATAIGSTTRGRGTWKIVGMTKKFAVEDCYKRITDPGKRIIISVAKDFDKLKLFPRGPGWLQLNVAKGPNSGPDPEHVPTFIDDDSFQAVVFGLSEGEVGADASYGRDQIDRLVKLHDNAEVRADRYIQLNSALLERSSSDVFRSIADLGTTSVLVYQDRDGAVDGRALIGRLGSSDVNFLMEAGMPSFFKEEVVANPNDSSSTTEATKPSPTDPEGGSGETGATESSGEPSTDDSAGQDTDPPTAQDTNPPEAGAPPRVFMGGAAALVLVVAGLLA